MLSKNFKLNFIQKHDYHIYYADKFFDDNTYELLDRNFPKFNPEKLDKYNHGKYSLKVDSDYYNYCSKESQILMDFSKFLKSDFFYKKVFKVLYLKILLANSYNLKRLAKYLRLPIFNKEKNWYDFLFSKIRVTSEFSYMENKSKIVPHVDSIKELCSILVYFPSLKNDNENYLLERNYGTVFWESNLKNYSNIHLISNFEEENFKNESKVIFSPKYLPNYMCGFIRNDKSWHTVEPLDIASNYIRRSININFMYEN